MTTADLPLLLLAFDHRTSLVRGLFGGDDQAAAARAPEAKERILAGLERALADEAPAGRYRPGVLVDEQYGGRAAAAAKAAGVLVAVAVERSGQAELQFEHGEAFAARLDAFDPDFAKVLVRFNVGGDAEVNARQVDRLKELSDHVATTRGRLMLELLVPPTPQQLEASGGDTLRYDVEQRPELTVAAIEQIRAGGVRAGVWKLEGLQGPRDAARVAAAAAPEPLLVLGRGADDAAVEHWLRTAAPIDGFAGFAIGRSIWWDAVGDELAGRTTAEAAERRIAAKYAAAVRTWLDAAG